MIHPTRVKESTVLTRSVSPLARIRAIAPEATFAVWSMKGALLQRSAGYCGRVARMSLWTKSA